MIRDVFITSLIDPEIQKELLKQTVEPRQALELAINMELGMRNQHQIQQHNKIVIPASVNAVQFPNSSRSPNCQNPNNFPRQNNRSTLYCSNCGGIWLPNHRDKCITKGKTSNKCGLLNHFAKICRKQNNAKPQNSKKKMVNIVEEEPHPKDSVNFLKPAKLYESDYSSREDNTVAVIENAVEKLEPLNMPIKICNINTTLLVDSGSACSILNRSLASQVVQNSPRAFWINEKTSPQLRTFSNEPIQVEGKIQSPITSNGWTCDSATFTVVADGLKSLIGRHLSDQLGLAVTQSTSHKGNRVNNIPASPEFKEKIAKTFPELISRIGRSRNHVAKSKIYKDFQPRHQKGRRIPINLQEKVNNELKKLLDEKHIIKLSSCLDKCFISPILVTVKKDQTIKLALDSKILNKAIHKNKYQMSNIDTLIESISQQVSAPASQNTTYFSTLDLKYAYSQLNLIITRQIIVTLT